MKITKKQLKQIIKEEIGKILSENERELKFQLGAKVRPVEDHYLRKHKPWGIVVSLPDPEEPPQGQYFTVRWKGARMNLETGKPYAHLYKPEELELYDETPEGEI